MRRAVVATIGLALLCAVSAAAQVPGRNGPIAYARAVDGGSELHVVAPDGSGDRVLGQGAEPAWSPDGRRLAFSDGGSVVGAAADGSDRIVLARGTGPAWTPDGREVAYEAAGAIRVVGAFGGSSHVLVARGADPAFAPDGLRLAYSRNGSVVVAQADGSGAHVVAPGTDPAWSPDGRRLAWLCDPYDLCVANADGSGSHVVYSAKGLHAASWSPDGTRIVFDAWTYVDACAFCHRYDVYTVAPDGTGVAQLVADGTDADWSLVAAPGTGGVLGSSVTRTVGTNHADRLVGTPADDTIYGRGGNDVIYGKAGRDFLSGDSGDDTIYAADGEVDTVTCGPGRDRVVADRSDHVDRSCELVERR